MYLKVTYNVTEMKHINTQSKGDLKWINKN